MAIQVPTELIEAARNGGPTQIEALLEIAWPEAYRLARAIVGERAGAEDAAQEACIIMYRTIGSLRNAAAFRVWSYRIVVREASARKRKQVRDVPAIFSVSEPTDEAMSIDVWNALATLPDTLRAVVVLRYFEDLSSREIGSVLRLAEGTVRFRLMIARRRLRPHLGDFSEPITQTTREVTINAI